MHTKYIISINKQICKISYYSFCLLAIYSDIFIGSSLFYKFPTHFLAWGIRDFIALLPVLWYSKITIKTLSISGIRASGSSGRTCEVLYLHRAFFVCISYNSTIHYCFHYNKKSYSLRNSSEILHQCRAIFIQQVITISFVLNSLGYIII